MILKKIIVLLLILLTLSVYALPTAKITLNVTDQEGIPIANAKVVMFGGTIGFTDIDGLYSAKDSTEPYVGFTVNKEGFYQTIGHFRDFTSVSGIFGFRRFKPWNPTVKVILKKIKNPIPMYVAGLIGKSGKDHPPIILPEEGKFFGFDLIKKDWVIPYGKGQHSDFIFKTEVASYQENGAYDLSMTLKFSNPNDGIIPFYAYNQYVKKGGSALRSPHHAPTDGYEKKLVIRNKQNNRIYKQFNRDDQNYFFRIRTKLDNRGNIIEAYYGKIYDYIGFSIPKVDKKGKIYFSYYLNPNNNDTNIEFSPKDSLFPKPKAARRSSYQFNP